jgi:hypothetical protein
MVRRKSCSTGGLGRDVPKNVCDLKVRQKVPLEHRYLSTEPHWFMFILSNIFYWNIIEMQCTLNHIHDHYAVYSDITREKWFPPFSGQFWIHVHEFPITWYSKSGSIAETLISKKKWRALRPGDVDGHTVSACSKMKCSAHYVHGNSSCAVAPSCRNRILEGAVTH